RTGEVPERCTSSRLRARRKHCAPPPWLTPPSSGSHDSDSDPRRRVCRAARHASVEQRLFRRSRGSSPLRVHHSTATPCENGWTLSTTQVVIAPLGPTSYRHQRRHQPGEFFPTRTTQDH